MDILPQANAASRLGGLLRSQPPSSRIYGQEARNRYSSTFTPGSKAGFEAHAFARLFDAREQLGIQELYRCNSARVDGFIRLQGEIADEPLLLEVKTTLSWNSLGAALAQFICGRTLLQREGEFLGGDRGLIVFSEFSQDWSRGDPHPLRPWAQLYLHLDELAAGFKIWALQLTPTGVYNPFIDSTMSSGLLKRLVENHRPGYLVYSLRSIVDSAYDL
jgi:hypothetical protein